MAYVSAIKAFNNEGVGQQKTITPYTTQQVVEADANYDYLSRVTVNAITYTEVENPTGITAIIGTVAPTT